MRAWLPIWLFISACSLGHFQDGPGGGPPVGGGPDAAPSTNDALALEGRILGTLCLIDDLADRGPCVPLENSGLTLSAESAVAVAAADGRFDIAGPARTGSLIITAHGDNTYVSGALLIQLDSTGGALGIEIPVIGALDLGDIVIGSGVTNPGGSAVMVIRTDTLANTPAANVAITTIIEGIDPFYDTFDTRVYSPGLATSTRGTGVYFGVVPQAQTYDVSLSRVNFSGTVTMSAVPNAVNIATTVVGN